MALNLHSLFPKLAPAAGTDAATEEANARWRENLMTAVATGVGVLVVALIAVLMSLA